MWKTLTTAFTNRVPTQKQTTAWTTLERSPHRDQRHPLVARTGAPWRDLPECYGPWQTCYDRLIRWLRDGTWLRILQALQARAEAQAALEWLWVAFDGSYVPAHPHAAGAPKPPKGALQTR